MNTSQFMDKQIMDLTSSPSKDKAEEKALADLMTDRHHHHHPPQHNEEYRDTSNNGIGIKKEDIVPSYDFQPIRVGLSPSLNLDSSVHSSARVRNSSENKAHSSSSSFRNYGSLDSINPANFNMGGTDGAILADIDRTMKKHADNILHVLEGVSSRLAQLETRTCNLENSVDDLKVSVGNNYGITDGKMRQMEHILIEVQSGILVLKDKKEMLEAQMQQVSQVDRPSESRITAQTEALHPAASAPPQSPSQHPPPVNFPHSISAPVIFPQSVPHPYTNVPTPALQQILPPVPLQNLPAAPQQNLPPTLELPNQFSQSQNSTASKQDPYLPTPVQTQDASNQSYQVPPSQQPQAPPPAPPHQSYHQPISKPSYTQLPQPHSQSPQLPLPQSSLGHLPEETAYIPSQTYPPNLRQPASQEPGVSPPVHTYYGAPPSHTYESPTGRSNSGFSIGYGIHSGPNEAHPYAGPTSQYGVGSTMKPHQHSSVMAHSGGGGYPQLPTARVLPQAIPSVSGVSGRPGSPGTGSRVPIDDVVDKVTSMGFPRDHVRATIRKMTENGQSVDLNMVLDKLMNDGEVQPRRGWFGP